MPPTLRNLAFLLLLAGVGLGVLAATGGLDRGPGLDEPPAAAGPSVPPTPVVHPRTLDPGLPGVTGWTQYRGDPLNLGESHSASPDWKRVGVVWKYWTGSYQSSTPAVADGKVIVCTEDGDMHCVDARTGSKLWRVLCTDQRGAGKGVVFCSPMILDGRVYIGNRLGQIWCIDLETGEKQWAYQAEGPNPEIYSSPKGDERGVVFGVVDSKSSRGTVVCLDPKTGAEKWRVQTAREVGSTAAIMGNSIYIPSKDRRLYEIDYATGETRRELALPGTTHATPTIAMGFAFLVTGGRQSIAVDLLEGTVAWQSDATSDEKTSVAFRDGRVFFPLGRFLWCFEAATGKKLWEFAADHKLAPPCVNGDVVLLSGRDNKFRVVSRDGALVHMVDLGEPCVAGPVLVDKRVYVCSDVNSGHHLFCLGELP